MADASWRGASGSGRDCTCSGRAGEERSVGRGRARSGLDGIGLQWQAWKGHLRQGVWRVAARWGLWRHGRHGIGRQGRD